MQTKLTLRMDDAVIKRAKYWAQTRGVPLSKAVAEFFASLPAVGEEPELTAWTRGLTGSALTDAPVPTDEGIADEYVARLEEKYR